MHDNLVTVVFSQENLSIIYLFQFSKFVKLQSFDSFELHVHVPSARNRRQDWGWLSSGGWAVLVTLANPLTLLSCEAQPRSMFEHPLISTATTPQKCHSRWVGSSFDSGLQPRVATLGTLCSCCLCQRPSLPGGLKRSGTRNTERGTFFGWDSTHRKPRLQDCNYIDRSRWHLKTLDNIR